jgi:hypothetical protein
MRAAILVATGALLLTLVSSQVTGTRLEVQDWDCPPAPASCARPVVVAGYPLPYISDFHGISPVGRTSLDGALLGEDHFHPIAFGLDLAIYGVALTTMLAAGRALTGQRRGGSRAGELPDARD